MQIVTSSPPMFRTRRKPVTILQFTILPKAILAMMILLATALLPASATPVSFDRFLSGISRCQPTPVFNTFVRSMVNKYANDSNARTARVKPDVVVAVPDDLRAHIDIANISSLIPANTDYTRIVTPVRGQWLKTPLRSITLIFGNENGINIISVEFAVSAAQVRKAFGAIVARNEQQLRRKGSSEEHGSVALHKASLYCDRST